MIVSRRWLEALLGRPLEGKDVADRLARQVAPVDAVLPIHQDLRDVLIARVLAVKQHPNADRLSLCQVDAGGGAPLEVVCGASNVQAGKTYPFAPVGATLPGGVKIERRKKRGVESNGMLCSAKELGLGVDHTGILELNTDAPPGTPFLEAIPIVDEQIVIDVSANRPDLLCHKGVARELAVSLGATVKLPEIHDGTTARRHDGTSVASATRANRATRADVDGVQVRLEDPEGAPRYMIAVMRGVKVGPSPAWLANRLQSVGQRSINNIVDATNYILFEINQPLHAFDLAKLRGPAVVVRRAKPSEQIVTLDGVERKLTPEMTAICDAERPQIVAGVMGSAESEVAEGTTDIVLEAAYFQPTRIRRTRRALGISSESSYRFERGIDMLGMPEALARAIDLIRAVAGGEIREAPLDLWPPAPAGPQQPRSVFLREARVAHLLGIPVPRKEIERLLSAVGFVVAPRDERMAVQVPGWRPDVTREVDLIEEVARLKGYDTFPDELRPYRPTTVPEAPAEITLRHIREHLVRSGGGLLEARTLPLGPADSPDAVPVQNPLSAEEAHLRSRLLPGLLRRVEHNWSVGQRDVRLFEVGTVFKKARAGARPDEELHLGIVFTGARHPAHWSDGGGAPSGERAKLPDMDIWDLKQHFELAVGVAAPFCVVQPAPDGAGWVAARRDAAGEVWGAATPLEADAPKWAAPLYGLEIKIAVGQPALSRYQPLPTQPPVVRDLSLVLPAGVTAAAVADVLRREGGVLLERLDVLDEYRGGPGLPAGTRGVTWRCTFRAPDRTLTETEPNAVLDTMLRAAEATLDVRRRSA
ncbi:MAG TPA: phenylalanine--tRNA ligase subunit beta [Gemmatimonadales bacterium]|nr:phenylalanine--tRNA ligase subunit beta [Gemmatimonadales bacterium]